MKQTSVYILNWTQCNWYWINNCRRKHAWIERKYCSIYRKMNRNGLQDRTLSLGPGLAKKIKHVDAYPYKFNRWQTLCSTTSTVIGKWFLRPEHSINIRKKKIYISSWGRFVCRDGRNSDSVCWPSIPQLIQNTSSRIKTKSSMGWRWGRLECHRTLLKKFKDTELQRDRQNKNL